MLNELKISLRRRTRFDVFVVIVVVLFGFFLSHQFDFLESIYHLSRQYEEYELDEFVPTLIFGALAFCYFSYRRWYDVKYLSLVLEEQSLTEPVTHIANRRALTGVLDQVAKDDGKQHGFILLSVAGLDHIRDTLGLITLEHVMIELLYLVNKELADNELIIAWHTGQFIVHTPNSNGAAVSLLAQRLAKINLDAEQSTVKSLRLKSAYTMIQHKVSENALLEILEDNLLDAR